MGPGQLGPVTFADNVEAARRLRSHHLRQLSFADANEHIYAQRFDSKGVLGFQAGDLELHLIPNVLNTVMVFFSLIVGVAIIIEASLSFLGVGVPEPTPTWGSMLAEARPTLIFERWTLTVAPGVAIVLIVLAVNLFGDWLRVRLDPQLRNR